MLIAPEFIASRLSDRCLLLQRMIVDRSKDTQELYWRATAAGSNVSAGRAELGPDGLLVQPNTALCFDTYFNAFFESLWRRHTTLGPLTLRVRVDGPCILRVHRRAGASSRLQQERVVTAGGTVEMTLADHAVSFRQHGLLWVEMVTGDRAVSFLEGSWFAEDAEPACVKLSAVFCTFNRERQLGSILDSIAADPAVAALLTRVFVVNQGRPGLARMAPVLDAVSILGNQLHIVEQANFGGSGGFGRGLLEALDDPAITHAVLLDDDITLEPDSLLRMAAFFALARTDIVVGGHMLDSVKPTTLYEAGAIISDRHWAFTPRHHSRDLVDPDVLEVLTHPIAVHYNGWWCCGIPLSIVREHGMPLPCFIRGDDLEFGLRLHQAGVTTVAVPGIAVWHDPFYLKTGGWHTYYETRNILIAIALHQPFERSEVFRRMARIVAMSLLTYRYYNAALILQGIRDFLAGPGILQASPQALHASLNVLRQRYPGLATPRSVVLEPQRLTRSPRRTASFLLTLGRLTVRNALVATKTGFSQPRLLPFDDLVWPRMRGVEHVAVERWWDEELPTFRRSRESFRALAWEAAGLLLRLYRSAPSQVARWQAALPSLTSDVFWRRYLGMGTGSETTPPVGRTQASAYDDIRVEPLKSLT